MRIVISGASGFLGAPLASALRDRGHDVVTLVRSEPRDGASVRWDPSLQQVDNNVIVSADAVINLSGSPISQWPRTAKRADEIKRSRVLSTSTLAHAIASAPSPPTFLSGSGMSWYGVDRGNDRLPESASAGTGFLADVAQTWEAAAQPAITAGSSVAFLRTSIVLDDAGGALKLMKVPFALGLGAQLGDGQQSFSVISRRDWINAVIHVLEEGITGPVNLAAPEVPTNRQFTKALGATLRRPAFFRAPDFAIRLALGGLADDLLGSLNVVPQVLLDSGFTFEDPTVDAVLAEGIS